MDVSSVTSDFGDFGVGLMWELTVWGYYCGSEIRDWRCEVFTVGIRFYFLAVSTHVGIPFVAGVSES